jgi:hypothetical protein
LPPALEAKRHPTAISNRGRAALRAFLTRTIWLRLPTAWKYAGYSSAQSNATSIARAECVNAPTEM